MNARTSLEQLALKTLVEGKLDRKALLAALELLRKSPEGEKNASVIDELSQLAGKRSPSADESQVCDHALSLLNALVEKCAATDSGVSADRNIAKSGADQLQYDISHGPEILDSFLSEVAGHLQTVEEKLIRLESHPGDAEALNAVFGAMHSLKGVAGFLNIKIAHEMAHEAEGIMELARTRANGIHASECDAMLKTVDVLRAIRDQILAHSRNPQSPPVVPAACAQVLKELSQIKAAQKRASVAVQAVSTISEELPVEPKTTRLQIGDNSGLVRVKVTKLDGLIEIIGELVVTQTQIQQQSIASLSGSQGLNRNLSRLGKLTRELQAIAMSLRMFPLRDLFGRMTRVARDVAQKQDKEIEVVIDGEDTELDKNVIEALVDPLTHLVRNAIDHGVDIPSKRSAAGKPPRARLAITARHQSGAVLVTVSDDGRGLDLNKIAARARKTGLLSEGQSLTPAQLRNLIFEPGFSTAEKVTEISGRGVGLDVVRRNVQALNGSVSVETVEMQSTTFNLTLPLTLAIIDGLIVRTGAHRYIVPIAAVVESVRPQPHHLSTVQGRGEMINVRGTILPVVRLSKFARVASDVSSLAQSIVMIVECNGERYGLAVDELVGQQQVVIRNLGECLDQIPGIASGAILGDGNVGLILDVADVLVTARQANLLSVSDSNSSEQVPAMSGVSTESGEVSQK